MNWNATSPQNSRAFQSLLYFFLFIFCLSTRSVAAQDKKDSDETIPPIVVTADKREVLEENVAASVSIITRKDIENQVAVTVPEVLRNLAGVNVLAVGSPGDDIDIRIRGSDRDEVLVLLDGVPINNVTEDRASFLGNIPLEIVERIEVVRGSQSILYGSDAVGGVVNIITRRGTKDSQVPLSFEGGNLETFRETLGVSGSPGKAQFFTLFTRMDQRGRFARDRFGGYSLNGNFTYQFNANTSLNLGANYFHSDQEIFYEFLTTFNPDIPAVVVQIDRDNNSIIHKDLTVGHLDFSTTPVKWWNLEFLYGLFVDRDGSFNSPVGDTAPDGFAPGAQDFHGQGLRHLLELKNYFSLYQSKNFSTDFTLGFEFKREKLTFNDTATALVFPAPGQEDSRNNYAPYFLQNFRFWDDALILSGGARFDHNTTFGSKWSPRASALYKLRKTGTTFRGSYGEGFHAPTIQDFFTAVLQRDLGLPFQAARLQAELTQSYDAEIEQKLGKWGEVGVAFFYIDFDRLFDELQFVNHAYTTGVEVNLELKPLERLRFGGNYTFLKAKNQDTGSRLADRPENTWNLFAEGRPISPLTLRLDVNGVGNRLIPNFITTDAGDLPVIFIDPDGRVQGGSFANALTDQGRTLSGYVKVDLAATYNIVKNRWHLKDWKVYGKVENILNVQYQEKFGFPAPGITFLLGTQAIF